jgi:hypothetical protein
MDWDDRLLALFDDLEQQAEGLALAARDTEVAELSRAEYAGVDLTSRLHGSVGHRLGLVVSGLGRLDAEVVRVGSDWCLTRDGLHEWLVRVAALERVTGLAEQAVDARHRPLGARLGFGSALRGVAEDALPVLVYLRGGESVRGVVHRVGADFVELRLASEDGWRGAGASASVDAVAFEAVAAVRRT